MELNIFLFVLSLSLEPCMGIGNVSTLTCMTLTDTVQYVLAVFLYGFFCVFLCFPQFVDILPSTAAIFPAF